MPISLVHVIEVNHQSVSLFKIQQLTTAFIANQIRVVSKPFDGTIDELYNGVGDMLIGRTNLAAKDQAVVFGQSENLNIEAGNYGYAVSCFDITVTLTESVNILLKFLNLEDAEKAYVELLTAASLSQVAQEKTKG